MTSRLTVFLKEITEQKKRFRSLLGWKSPTIKKYARKIPRKKVQQWSKVHEKSKEHFTIIC